MSPRATLILVAIASALTGAALGTFLASGDDAAPVTGPSTVSSTNTSATNTMQRFADLERDHDALQTRHNELEREVRSFREQVAREHEESSKPAERSPVPVALVGDDLVVSLGRWGDEPALRKANWNKAGRDATDILRARRAGIGGGRPRHLELLEKKALRELRAQFERIDSESSTQGLSKHPVVYLNMMAAHLAHAGQPFEDWQLERIDKEGERYENASTRCRETRMRTGSSLSPRKNFATYSSSGSSWTSSSRRC